MDAETRKRVNPLDLHRENTERLTAVETGLKGTNETVARLAATVEKFAENLREDFKALAREFAASRRPDYMVLIAGASLIVVLCTTLGAAALAPLYLGLSYQRGDVEKLNDWVTSYQRGQIPSSAEPKLAAIDKQFIEVETQFHAFRDVVSNEAHYAHERADANQTHIEENRHALDDLRDRMARLEERTKGAK